MAVGAVFKRCACRDERGRSVGSECPKLAQTWHGQWAYRVELPPDSKGTRRPRRRSGFASATDAQAEMDQVRELLGVPDADDTDATLRVGTRSLRRSPRSSRYPRWSRCGSWCAPASPCWNTRPWSSG